MNQCSQKVRDLSRLEVAIKHAKKRFDKAITLAEAQDAMAEVEIMTTHLDDIKDELVCSIKSKEN